VSAYCTINAALDSTNVATVQSARPGGRNSSSEMKMRTRQDTSTSRENKMVTFHCLAADDDDDDDDEHESIYWLSYGNRARDAKC
jgi:hypothetical protein